MLDLHTHTTASDGQYAPGMLVRKAKQQGITTLAITDHDSVDGLLEGKEEAERQGIEYIPGIEISVKSENEMHILGYFIDYKAPVIQKACDQFVQFRRERTGRIIEYLKNCGILITQEEVEKKAGLKVVGRPHFAQVLLEKGYVGSMREAFDRYLATPEFAKIERPKPSAKKGIQIIHEAGGIAVLAHPMTLKLEGDLLRKQLSLLKEWGLDGIETYYSKHSNEQILEYHKLALKYQFIETAGSDFHGETVKPDIFLGRKQNSDSLLVSMELQDELRTNLWNYYKNRDLIS